MTRIKQDSMKPLLHSLAATVALGWTLKFGYEPPYAAMLCFYFAIQAFRPNVEINLTIETESEQYHGRDRTDHSIGGSERGPSEGFTKYTTKSRHPT